MLEFRRLVFDDFAASGPLFLILFIAMVLDVIGGVTLAWKNQTLNSSASAKGMIKKVMMGLLVAFSSLIDPFFPNLTLPGTSIVLTLAGSVALSFLVSEGISLVENASRAGVWIPEPLKNALAKLRNPMEGKAISVELHPDTIDALKRGASEETKVQ